MVDETTMQDLDKSFKTLKESILHTAKTWNELIVNHDATTAQAILDEKISEVEALLSSSLVTLCATLRRGRNAHRQVNQVPADVLRLIFDEVLDIPWQTPFGEELENIRSEDPSHYKLAPLRLSQVCAHWRNVALTYPRMWSVLDLVALNEQTMDLFAKRSGTYPLTIAWEGEPQDKTTWAAAATVCKENMSRIRFLQVPHLFAMVDNRPPHWSSFRHARPTRISWLNAAAAPLLEELDIINFEGPDPCAMDIMSGGRPLLRALSISGYRIPMEGALYHSRLTSLTLVDHLDPEPDQSHRCLILLSSLPTLQHLVLELGDKENAAARANEQFTIRFNPGAQRLAVRLPALRTLSLDVIDVPHLKYLITSIKVDPSQLTECFLTPWCWGPITGFLDPHTIPPAFLTRFITTDLVICLHSASVSISNCVSSPPREIPLFDLTWHSWAMDEEVATPMDGLGLVLQQLQESYTPLSDSIKRLAVAYDHASGLNFRSTTMRPVVERLVAYTPRLQELILLDGCGVGYCPILRSILEDNEQGLAAVGSGDSAVRAGRLWPSLNCITAAHGGLTPEDLHKLAQLIECLTSRGTVRTAPFSLVLISCTLDHDWAFGPSINMKDLYKAIQELDLLRAAGLLTLSYYDLRIAVEQSWNPELDDAPPKPLILPLKEALPSDMEFTWTELKEPPTAHCYSSPYWL